MQRHMNDKHEHTRDYICNVCSEVFPKQSLLRTHKRNAHSLGVAVKKHPCPLLCGASFAYPNEVRKHVSIIHEKKREHLCDVCGDDFQTFSSLTVHKRGHTGERPFLCKICRKTFTRSYECKRHVRRVHHLTVDARMNNPFNSHLLPIEALPADESRRGDIPSSPPPTQEITFTSQTLPSSSFPSSSVVSVADPYRNTLNSFPRSSVSDHHTGINDSYKINSINNENLVQSSISASFPNSFHSTFPTTSSDTFRNPSSMSSGSGRGLVPLPPRSTSELRTTVRPNMPNVPRFGSSDLIQNPIINDALNDNQIHKWY